MSGRCKYYLSGPPLQPAKVANAIASPNDLLIYPAEHGGYSGWPLPLTKQDADLNGMWSMCSCVTSRNIRLRHLRSYDTSAPSTSPTSTTISHYTLSIIKVSLYSLVFFVFLCILKNNISYDTSAMTTICTNTLCYVPTQLSTIASATD